MQLDPTQLPANARFLVLELLKRGVGVEALTDDLSVLLARLGEHVECLLGIESSIVSRPAVVLTDNKHLTKLLLRRAEITVTKGEQFSYETRFGAMAYSIELGGAVVLKPTIGTCGRDLYLPLENLDEVTAAIEAFYRSQQNNSFIIEEFFPGNEFRIFITKDGKYAGLYREPAYVIGDGRLSIRELAENESDYRMNPRKGCLCGIVLDDAAALYLAKTACDFNTVPKKGEKLHLRANSNLITGGTCTDVTDSVHPSVLEICKRALNAFPKLPYAGIDFMTTDISAPQTKDSYRIIEVNSEPSIGMHIAPWEGKGRNLAEWVADLIFPETR